MKELEDAIAKNNMVKAVDSVPWERLDRLKTDLSPELQTILNQGGAIAARAMLPRGIDIAFDTTNPAAVSWVQQHAAELVTQNISPTTREAIRTLMEESFVQGITPAQTARMIRDHIGILPRHVNAVLRYREELLQRFPLEEAERRAQRYAQQLRNFRARMIARTETIRASNQGQHELWRQAMHDGLMNREEWERIWIASDACEICNSLHGTRAPMDGMFLCAFNGQSYKMPPDPHPQCRCACGAVKKEE